MESKHVRRAWMIPMVALAAWTIQNRPASGQGCDPLEIAKLTAFDAAADDRFGVSISADSGTVIVGSFFDDDVASRSGSAYVYVYSAGAWSLQAKVTASDPAEDDYFGVDVSLSGDTAIIGAYGDDDVAPHAGAAYIFVRSNDTWMQQAKLTPPDGEQEDYFGRSVAISGDTAVIGSYWDDDAGENAGSAYIFVRSGGIWTQQAKLTAADAVPSDRFGESVAIDGDTAIVGAPNVSSVSPTHTHSGAAYVFVRSGITWSQQAKLVAIDGTDSAYLGQSVSVDGDTALIGTYGSTSPSSPSGSAYVFVRSGDAWTQESKLIPTCAAADIWFGWSVGVSGDTAVIGAPYDNGSACANDAAYVFVRSGTETPTWTQRGKFRPANVGVLTWLGYDVSISGDTAFVGAYQDDDEGIDSGSVYALDLNCESACCIEGQCVVVERSVCDTLAGTFFAFGTTCDDIACPSICAADIVPCPGGDGVVDIFDILAALDGFAGADCCSP